MWLQATCFNNNQLNYDQMKIISKQTILVFTGTLLLFASTSARAADEEGKAVQLNKIPAPAAAAITKWAKGEKIASVMSAKEGGAATYEAAVKGEGTAKREITVNAVGKTLSEEQVIPLASAPEAVQKAAAKQSVGGKLMLVEKIVAAGETYYEIEVAKNGKTLETELTAKCKVKPEKK